MTSRVQGVVSRVYLLVSINALCAIGGWTTAIALYGIITFSRHGSIAQNAGILFWALLPSLFVMPAVTPVLRRFDAKYALFLSFSASAACVIGMIESNRLGLLYVLIALQSVAGAIVSPAQFVILPTMVQSRELGKANAIISQWNSLMKVISPVLAGVLVGLFGPRHAMWIDVALTGVGAVVALRLPRTRKDANGSAIRATTRLIDLLSDARVCILLCAMGLATALAVTIDVLLPVFIRDALGGGAEYFSWLLASFSAGSVIVSSILARCSFQASARSVLLGILTASMFPLLVLASLVTRSSIETGTFVILGCLIDGGATALVATSVNTILQQVSSTESRPLVGTTTTWAVMAAQVTVIAVSAELAYSIHTYVAFYLVALATTAAVAMLIAARGNTIEVKVR